MTKRTTILLLVAVLAIGVSTALAGSHDKTIEGTLVDTKCYTMNPKNVGNDHMSPNGVLPNCASACAKMGIPVAILTADGKVFTLAVPAAQLADYMAKEARVTGVVKGGVVVAEKIEVKEGGTWKPVNIGTMM
jgi:hypothetical protein